jgi:hypothetical protein
MAQGILVIPWELWCYLYLGFALLHTISWQSKWHKVRILIYFYLFFESFNIKMKVSNHIGFSWHHSHFFYCRFQTSICLQIYIYYNVRDEYVQYECLTYYFKFLKWINIHKIMCHNLWKYLIKLLMAIFVFMFTNKVLTICEIRQSPLCHLQHLPRHVGEDNASINGYPLW